MSKYNRAVCPNCGHYNTIGEFSKPNPGEPRLRKTIFCEACEWEGNPKDIKKWIKEADDGK